MEPEEVDLAMAEDLVGVASARLLAAGLPLEDRRRALALLGILAGAADRDRLVRRPFDQLVTEFELPARRAERWLDDLLAVGAVRRQGAALVVAGAEPPPAGGLRLENFLADVAALDERRERRRSSRPVGRAAAAVLAAALVASVALLPGLLDDRATTSRALTAAAETSPAAGEQTTSGEQTVASGGAPDSTAASASSAAGQGLAQHAPPCPAGAPVLAVVASAVSGLGGAALDGTVTNPTDQPLVLHAAIVSVTVTGSAASAPVDLGALTVPPGATRVWKADAPLSVPAGAPVAAAPSDWSWSDPALAARCPSGTTEP